MTKIAAGLVLAAAATGAQAAPGDLIGASIVEISAVSTLASADASALAFAADPINFANSAGGNFFFGAETPNQGERPTATPTFNSTGSGAVGIIANGVGQADNNISTGFLFGGVPFDINTIPLSGPDGITGSIVGGVLSMDLSAWGGVWQNTGAHRFILGPDNNLLTSVEYIGTSAGVDSWYYTADWSHTITAAEDFSGAFDEFGDPIYLGFTGNRADWHLEGIATSVAAVPEASTYGMMLAGLGLVGFAVRRRKLVA